MKKQLILMAISLLIGLQAAAGTYYVDAEKGNDGWSGTAETAAADVETSLIGPKKTLAEIMKVAKTKNDVVIALPGEYDEGVSNPDAKDQPNKLMRRVIVPAGVTLKSKEGPEVTFIVGESSTDAGATAIGCGLNAVGCVENNAGSVVQGFTITGGRTVGSNTYSKESYGAGVCGGIAIGCVISNNACAGRGGAAYNSTLCGCRTYDNKAADCSPVLHNGTAYGCYFADGQSRASTFYNCTFGGDAYPHSSSSYNCLIFGKGSSSNANPKFYRCLKAITRSDDTDEDGTAVMDANSISVDDCGRITKGLDLVKDLGNNDYLSGLSGLPEACNIDSFGGRRMLNGIVDIGGAEHNPSTEFSAILSAQANAMTVTDETAFVTGKEESVSIGANQTLWAMLNKFGENEQTTWGFYAEVEGSGSLRVYCSDDLSVMPGVGVPLKTVVKADGEVRITYTAADSTALKVVYEGADGAAEISRFFNHTSVKIMAASDGVVVSGDIAAVGETTVAAGETKTFTIARANNPSKLVRGIKVNGEFVDFNDFPDGKTFTVSGDDVFASLDIETVYADTVSEWFVDAVYGNDDANCGYYANMAFKTLAKAAKVANKSGDVIVALPGVYDEGVSNPEAKDQSNKLMRRVIVPAGVTLRSKEGPEVTFIVGESSTDAGATDTGCGLNAVGCVENGDGSVVQGFTITGGRTVGSNTWGKDSYGAGVCGGIAIGCVISNNACAGRGGAAYNSTLCGCRAYDNKATEAPVLYHGTAYGCYFADGQARDSMFYNCTFGGDAYPHSSSSYNCLIFGKGSSSNANPKFYRCLKAITRSDDTDEDGTAVMAANSISVDDCGRITKGQDLVKDLGNNDYLSGLSGLPEACMIDCMGGQRVYNRVVDIGGSEIDWRGDFAKSLAKRGVAVEYASAGVTTNAVAGVDISDGDELSVICTLKTSGRVSFFVSISGEGVATVKRGATELLPEAGVYSFVGQVGESVVTVTFSGKGIATVRDFQLPKQGLLILVK